MRYFLIGLMLAISTINAFRMNIEDKELQAFKQDLLSRVNRKHPIVKELGDSEHGDPYKFDTPGMNNKTNSMNYEF